MLMSLNFIIAYISIFTNNNILQIFGFLYSIIIVLFILPKNFFIELLFIALSIIISYYDSTLISSKIILLIFLFIFSRNIKIIELKKLNKKYLNFLLLIFIFIDFIQLINRSGAPGIFETYRLSGGMWDPNYFSLFILILFFFYHTSSKYVLALLLLAQSSTNIAVFIIYSYFKRFLPYVLVLSILIFILYPIFFDNLFNYFDNQYIKDRLFSFNLRVQWAQNLFDGDDLDGIAPHNSFISGLKKSPILTCLYFLLLLIFSKNRVNLYSLLIISMTTDVILGPICFLIPFLLHNNDSKSKY